MELVTLISADILFLILLALGSALYRRLERLEKSRARSSSEDDGLRALTKEVDRLRTELRALSLRFEKDDAAEEELKARLAEKRFTDGLASILGYDSDAKGARNA